MLDALAFEPEWLPRRAREPAGQRRDRRRRARRRGRRRPGRRRARRRRRSARDPCRSCSEPPASCSPRSSATPPTRRCACKPSATRSRARWHAMGVMLSAAGSLRWLQAILGADYDVLTAEASAWAPSDRGAHVPALSRRRAHARTTTPTRAAPTPGSSLRHDRGALVRALLEGVAFGLRDSLDLIGELGGRPALGRVSGGGARSEEWLRIVASVLELPLERVAVEDAAAFGAALLGGVAGGVWPDVPRGRRRDRAPARADRARAPSGSSPTAPRASASAPSTRRCAHAADAARRRRDLRLRRRHHRLAAARRDGDQRRAARARLRAAHAPPRLARFIGPPTPTAFAELTGAGRGLARSSPRASRPTTSIFARVYLEQTRLIDGMAELLRRPDRCRSRSRPPRSASSSRRCSSSFGLELRRRQRARALRAEGADGGACAAGARRARSRSSSATASTTSTRRAPAACA